MLRKPFYLLLALSAPALADDTTAQRLWQNTRQTVESRQRQVLEEAGHIQTGIADEGQYRAVFPQDRGRELFEAVNRNDWPSVRTLLAQYRRQPQHDPDIALFAQAALARGEGNLKQSRQDYETLLQRQPGFIRGRLDLARVLFEDQLNRESEAEFGRIPAGQLPEAVQDNVAQFRSALAERKNWHGSVSLGGIWSSNSGEGSGQKECWDFYLGDEYWQECQEGAPKNAAFGLSYEAAASHRLQIRGHHGLASRVLAYGKIYRDNQADNEHTLNLSSGYQYADARRTLTLAPLWEWSAEGKHALYRAYGLRTEWNEIRNRWSWNTEAEWKRAVYFSDGMQHNNHRLASLFNTLAYSPDSHTAFFGGLDWQQRHADEASESYRQPALRIGAAKQLGNGFDASFHALFRHRSFKQANESLGNRRRENEQIYSLSIGAERWQIAGVKPVFSFRHRRVNSNIPLLYSFRQNEAGISLSKSF